MGSIGLRSETLDLQNVQEFREQGLDRLMNIMASAQIVVGPSSGPMHLASLCGTPHLVWTDRRTYAMRKTSREKYETWWNPFHTPVTILDDEGFDVDVQRVLGEVKRAVETPK